MSVFCYNFAYSYLNNLNVSEGCPLTQYTDEIILIRMGKKKVETF
jgi:hypothetical protein